MSAGYQKLIQGPVWLLKQVLVVAFALLVLDVLWGVASRYVLGHQSRWTEELALFLLIWVSMLGAAVVYEEKAHLGVDYFVGKLDVYAQRWASLMVDLIVMAFSLLVLVYGGWVLVVETLKAGQVSTALGIPMGYVYMAVPISGVFFVLFGLGHMGATLAAKAGEVDQKG